MLAWLILLTDLSFDPAPALYFVAAFCVVASYTSGDISLTGLVVAIALLAIWSNLSTSTEAALNLSAYAAAYLVTEF